MNQNRFPPAMYRNPVRKQADVTYTNWGWYTDRIHIRAKIDDGVVTILEPDELFDFEMDELFNALALSAGSLE